MPLLCPYMKYDNWYIPSCSIAFPTDIEAWEYLYEHSCMNMTINQYHT